MKKLLTSAVLAASLVAAASTAVGGDRQNDTRVVCHQTGDAGAFTLVLDRDAAQKHLRHGDYPGYCIPE